jgi:putative endonuclease
VLYTGVTNDLLRRVSEHKTGVKRGFTSKYNVDVLVHFEEAEDVTVAIAREKQIKAGSRAKKLALISQSNPEWRDYFTSFLVWRAIDLLRLENHARRRRATEVASSLGTPRNDKIGSVALESQFAKPQRSFT